ncbi:MAG: radical SAM protein [Oscillospiraceae bacterium]|jgi:hypothetical protein|nr:radical SAM protein [Oscillospiraceae bacterium]
MNPYIKNLNRIEFLLTFACTGRCKHCSEGDHANTGEHINAEIAADMVRKVAGSYDIKSLMTFGGEPLLYPEEVCKIQEAARDAGIAERQLITNGFFSRDEEKIRQVAHNLARSGVNNLLLSVDAFHQETIPIGPVITFAKAVQEMRIPKFRVHPAWLVGEDADNPYNNKTREILSVFKTMGIPVSNGNVIFPGGNALKYLSEYFDFSVSHVSRYAENPQDIKAICVIPNGNVLGCNIYKTDIIDILKNYDPEVVQ